jgi:hypothetical protein
MQASQMVRMDNSNRRTANRAHRATALIPLAREEATEGPFQQGGKHLDHQYGLASQQMQPTSARLADWVLLIALLQQACVANHPP